MWFLFQDDHKPYEHPYHEEEYHPPPKKHNDPYHHKKRDPYYEKPEPHDHLKVQDPHHGHHEKKYGYHHHHKKQKNPNQFYQFGYQVNRGDDYHGHAEQADVHTNSKIGEFISHPYQEQGFCTSGYLHNVNRRGVNF